MDESFLRKLSVCLTLISLFSLYLISSSISIPLVTSLEEAELGQEVSFRGRVSQISSGNNTLFLTVAREITEESVVLLFSSANLSIQEGDLLEFEGSVEEYAGSPELIANQVTLLE